MNIEDIQHSLDCRVDIVHISVPSSDIQIYTKLKKDRNWVMNNLMRCIEYACRKETEITIGLEDSSRADNIFLLNLISVIKSYSIKRVRYADTVGIATRRIICSDIGKMIHETGIDVEMHAHNDFGMAVSNSISALRAGAKFIDCTIGGIGERSGNCSFLHFMKAVEGQLGLCNKTGLQEIREIENLILKMLKK